MAKRLRSEVECGRLRWTQSVIAGTLPPVLVRVARQKARAERHKRRAGAGAD